MENFVDNVENSNTQGNSSERLGNDIPALKQELLGNNTLTLDDKGRIVIPVEYRSILESGFVISRYISRDPNKLCLKIYTMSAWKTFYNSLSRLNEEDRGTVLGAIDVHSVELKQGRFVIPSSLREYAGLEGKLIFKGVGDCAELWNKERYDEQLPKNTVSVAELLYGG